METQTQTKSKAEKIKRRLQEYEALVSEHEQRVEEKLACRDEALRQARVVYTQFSFYNDLEKSRDEEAPPTDERPEYQEPTEEELEQVEVQVVEREKEFYALRIQKATEKLERERRKTSQLSEGEVYEKYKRAHKEAKDAVAQLDKSRGSIARLRADVEEREKQWKRYRKHLSKTTNMKFNNLLELNAYSGKLGFDHTGKDLSLNVKKDHTAGGFQDAKTLRYVLAILYLQALMFVSICSGGEKSFTTMCLLLALGESLETPFRILDEVSFRFSLSTTSYPLTDHHYTV